MNTAAAKQVVADLDRDIAELEEELKKARSARAQVAERYGLSPSRPSRSTTSSDREGAQKSKGPGADRAAPSSAHAGAVRPAPRNARAHRKQADADPPASGPASGPSASDANDEGWVRVGEASDAR